MNANTGSGSVENVHPTFKSDEEKKSENLRLPDRIGRHRNVSTSSSTSGARRRNSPSDASRERAPGISIPLVEREKPQPPLAGPEIDDLDDNDDRVVVTDPYPGVDDGFFSNGNAPRGNGDPEVENVPVHPDDYPALVPRAGNGPDEPDGRSIPPKYDPPFPYGPDAESGGMGPDVDSLPDINVYQNKKTLAQGMMDLALLSANANQLRYVLESYNRHPYFYPSLVMVSISLIVQVNIRKHYIY